jgi:hypothetical protein
MIEFLAFPVIVVFCYFVGFTCKKFKNKKLDAFIPSICGAVGAILGLVIFITIPGYIPADNWAVAVAANDEGNDAISVTSWYVYCR